MANPQLPHFVRWAWAGLEARRVWEPKLVRAQETVVALERLAVLTGILPVVCQNVPANQLVAQIAGCSNQKLIMLPLAGLDSFGEYTTDRPDHYRCLIVRPDQYESHLPMGKYLTEYLPEYPLCCRDAYTSRRVNSESTHDTYDQLCASENSHGIASTLWGVLGVKLVPHVPCRYDCAESMDITSLMIELGNASGYHAGVQDIQDLLNLPFTWSRLFGIAEMTTRVLKYCTNTTWTPTIDSITSRGDAPVPEQVFPLLLRPSM